MLDYGFDWKSSDPEISPYLAANETIKASEWIVPDGITVDDAEVGTTTTKVWLSGGTVGNTYLISNRITTSGGRTDERSIQIIVEDR